MAKRIISLLLICTVFLTISGCWDYKGLDEMEIVVGIAMDKDETTGKYQLTFEAIDTAVPIKQKGLQSKIIESEGDSFLDASRNAKKMLARRLNISDTLVLIISHSLAEKEGIKSVIDLFTRNSESRETVFVVISQEKSAKELFLKTFENTTIPSLDIKDILMEDKNMSSSTNVMPLYKINGAFLGSKSSISIPAIRLVENNKKMYPQVNGVAVLKDDFLEGYLTSEESKFLLFLTDKVKGGALVVPRNDDGKSFTLEILESKTKRSIEKKDNKFKIVLDTTVKVSVADLGQLGAASDKNTIKNMESDAEKYLKQEMENVVAKVKYDFNSDIFDFANSIYKKDFKLWKSIESDWKDLFKTVEVEIKTKIMILDTSTSR